MFVAPTMAGKEKPPSTEVPGLVLVASWSPFEWPASTRLEVFASVLPTSFLYPQSVSMCASPTFLEYFLALVSGENRLVLFITGALGFRETACAMDCFSANLNQDQLMPNSDLELDRFDCEAATLETRELLAISLDSKDGARSVA